MSFSIDGLVSGLNTTSIIDGLVQLQQRQVSRLTQQKLAIAEKQTAFKGVEARLLNLQTSLTRLNRSASSVFDSRSTKVSDESALTAAAGSGAQIGAFSLRVNSLAVAEQIASQGFSGTTASITQGTISLQVGDRAAKTITVDSSNATASGLVAAINSQSTDVSAALVKDQATGLHRILLTSKHTGESNQITVGNNLAPTGGGATQPDFTGTVVQAATNASVTIGSGAGAISAEYESNRIDDLIEGVSISLNKADASKEISIAVAADHEGVVSAVQDFVDEFNDIIKFISSQTKYVPDAKVASPLLGNRSASEVQSRLRAIAIQSVPGLASSLNRLSRIGVSVTDSGSLTFDSSKLTKALNGELEGVAPGDVRKLFGLTGSSNNAGVSWVLGSSRTTAATAAYQVDITQAAERASIFGGAITGPIVIDNTNNTLQLKLDGQDSGALTLAAGSYTPEALASHVQSVINSATALGNRKVNVNMDAGQMRIASASYGLNSKVSDLSGSGLATLGFTGSETGIGQDVVGRFIVNGQIEAAKGTGRLLVGDSANANTADIQLRVSLASDQVNAGIEAEVTVTRGVSGQLDKYLTDVLNPEKGQIHTANQSFTKQIESVDASIKRVNAIAESKRASLVQQFNNLEKLLSQLQSTSSFVSGQLASFSSLQRKQ